MNQTILDGNRACENDRGRSSRAASKKFANKLGFAPVLATILVGNDPSSEIYVNMKGNACRRVGLEPRRIALGENTTTGAIAFRDRANSIATRKSSAFCSSIRFPGLIDERKCFNAIALEKDVDGVTALGFGAMALGQDAFVSATPGGIMKLLDHYRIPIAGEKRCRRRAQSHPRQAGCDASFKRERNGYHLPFKN